MKYERYVTVSDGTTRFVVDNKTNRYVLKAQRRAMDPSTPVWDNVERRWYTMKDLL